MYFGSDLYLGTGIVFYLRAYFKWLNQPFEFVCHFRSRTVRLSLDLVSVLKNDKNKVEGMWQEVVGAYRENTELHGPS